LDLQLFTAFDSPGIRCIPLFNRGHGVKSPPLHPPTFGGSDYSIVTFLSDDLQKTSSVLTSTKMMSMMSSLVENLVYSSLQTTFIEFTRSISPSSTNRVPSLTSSSQMYSSVIQATLSDDAGIQTYISSVNTIFTCNSAKH
jgi:hypothetical protein